MARVDLDMSEVDRWTDVLLGAPGEIRKGARAVVSKGALNIKNEAQRTAPGSGHAKHYPRSITYDIETDVDEIVAEIGPKRGRRQWGLGNLLEYGSENNPPHPHLEPALDHEEPRFIAACADLTEDALDG